MSKFDSGFAPPSSRAAELAAHPDAARWARDCAWVPGTGQCRNRPCSADCLFRAQREAEAQSIVRSRQKRRPTQRASIDRVMRIVSILVFG